MRKKEQRIRILMFLWIISFLLSMTSFALASSPDPNTELGIFLFEQGQYNEAVQKFQSVLEKNPSDPEASKYLRLAEQSLQFIKTKVAEQPSANPVKATNQAQAVNKALDQLETLGDLEKSYVTQKRSPISATRTPAMTEIANSNVPLEKKGRTGLISSYEAGQVPEGLFSSDKLKEPIAEKLSLDEKPSTASIHGNIRMGFGYETSGGGEFIWKQANFNLNEKNYRMISWDQLNQRENTYDPAIYDRMEFNVDVEPIDNPLSFHTNVAIDPWSYVGKSKKTAIQGTTWADSADVQLLYAGNTAYTMPINVDTLYTGDILALPELKLVNGRVSATNLTTKFGNTLVLPETDIETWFQPVRELWVDYEPNDSVKLEFFPLALEDKALTTDDPLSLSNNKTWWEESPWLASWKKGHVNAGANPVDFTKGEWDDDLAFATRDSEGKRLTALRGFSTEYKKDDTELQATFASPKTLWQDYDVVDAIATSIRAKQHFSEGFYIGMLDNAHLGYVNRDLDSYNIVTGLDTGLMLNPGAKISAEYAFSYAEQDLTTPDYDSRQRGSAYDMQLVGTSSYLSGADQDYFRIQPGEDELNFFKTRLRLSRMDKGFQSSLATYLETRDDEFWSRHITFRDPVNFQTISFDDIDPFRIGNGIDYDRYVINWRSDFSFANKEIKGLTDIRNVHQASTNKYVETVARTEWGWQPTKSLETKALLLAHNVPLTTGGFDPYITRLDGGYMANTAIKDGEDANLYTASTGLKYWFTNWLAWDGTWERTNDFTVATDNYPRGIFNDTSVTTYSSYGNIYREDYTYLYSQGYFPLPPYQYHDIFRTGITLKPNAQWDLYLDYTRNPYEFAGPIDENMNHVGLAAAYSPKTNLQMFMKYTWSRCNNINDLLYNNGEVNFQSHHNVFFETRYLFKDESRITASFGVGPSIYNAYASGTPFAGSTSPTLDTQKIIRIFYTKTF